MIRTHTERPRLQKEQVERALSNGEVALKVRLNDDDARQYVLRGIGFNMVLASMLHERALTNPREVWAIVPDDAVFQERNTFSSALGASMSSARELLADFVMQEITSLGDGIALFVDVVRESSTQLWQNSLACFSHLIRKSTT